jgi:mannose-6-phosphate isomerase-like protein (cupin superfamily)
MKPRVVCCVFVSGVVVLSCASQRPEPTAQAIFSCPVTPIAPTTVVPAVLPRPIQATLPALRLENLRFRDQVTCERGDCVMDTLSPLAPTTPAIEDGATTLPPAMAWVHIVKPGATVVIPQRNDVDVLGVCLVGDAMLGLVSTPRAEETRVAAWTAFALRKGGLTVRTTNNQPTAVLLVTARGVASETGSQAQLVTSDLVTLEDLSWANGAMHARIAFDATVSPNASLGVLFASDDAAVAEHQHAGAWEVLAAVSASGRLHLPAQTVETTSQQLPERSRTVTAGTIAYVPAGVRHAWLPDGTHPLVAIQVYSPAGSEQRFRALAAPQTSATSTAR